MEHNIKLNLKIAIQCVKCKKTFSRKDAFLGHLKDTCKIKNQAIFKTQIKNGKWLYLFKR